MPRRVTAVLAVDVVVLAPGERQVGCGCWACEDATAIALRALCGVAQGVDVCLPALAKESEAVLFPLVPPLVLVTVLTPALHVLAALLSPSVSNGMPAFLETGVDTDPSTMT